MQSERNEATAVMPAEPNLRSVAVARIVVPEGFNPRGRVVEDRELAQLADSIRRHGVLQPIRVRATEDGGLVLIAGERRYRAAVKAGVSEVPVIVRPAGAGDAEEEADLLVEAVIENDLRVDLDPLSRARGYRRLLDSGLTVKGVAERLQTTQARVKEHLQILKLPEGVQSKVADREVPLRAIKPLEALARIHPGLADAAAGEVLSPGEDAYQDAYTWADLERDPLTVATHAGELPEGVYRANVAYPADRFELSEKARKDLAGLEKLIATAPAIRFGYQELEQARALGAAHGEQWDALIVGVDVASQLAGDYIARCLKTQRANERRLRHTAADGQDHTNGGDDEEARREAKQAEREAERQARQQATAFNAELGRAIYTALSRVKVDERTLKLLATVDVAGELGDLAMRGARYGFPGWVEEAAQRNGKTKLVYVEQRTGAEQRALDYLAGAATAGDIAGRQIALVAMAVFADQDAVAMSNRSWHQVKRTGPWADEFDELLDELVRDKLPAGAITLLEPRLVKRGEQRVQTAAEREQHTAALGRLDGVEDRIPTLDVDELAAVEQDLDIALPGYDPRRSELRRLIQARVNQLTSDSEAR